MSEADDEGLGPKWSEKFGWLSRVVWPCRLDSHAKVVLFALVERSGAGFTCFPSIRLISEDCALGRATTVRALGKLVAAGLLVRTKRRVVGSKRLRSSEYALVFDVGVGSPVSRGVGSPVTLG